MGTRTPILRAGRLNWLAVLALLFSLLPAWALPAPALAVSPNVVISQVYGGGGNTGAPYTHDFIELFNRGTTSVPLNGWSVQYASATGTGNFGGTTSQITPLPNISLEAGQYLLVQGAGGATGAALPEPYVTDITPINLSATGGKVALVNTTDPLGCNGGSTLCDAAATAKIVDLVGYGSANYYEGAAAPAATNTTSVQRKGNGCVDTDNNSADFTAGAPAPRNTASPRNLCVSDPAPAVSSTAPAANAGGVALNANITINFSEAVNVSGAWYSISCVTSGAHSAVASGGPSGGPSSFTLNPDADFSFGEKCTVTISAALVSDQDANDPPDNMAADYIFSFTAETAPVLIREIQGETHLSPLAGQSVSKVFGIVTATRNNGFYMQDPSPDTNDATSEGIFVFTSSAPAVSAGQAVRVSGVVSEFRPGGSGSTNLTTTQISSPTIQLVSSNNPLPAALVGVGGRVPPSTVIEDDAAGSVETTGQFDPAQDGIDFWESLEGMRLQVNNAVAVGPRNNFGEIPVLADNGANAGLRTPRDGIIIRSTDYNPERIILDDTLRSTPPVNVGDSFPGALYGVLDYSFFNFKLYVTELPADVSGGLARESVAAATANQLAVASFNVENLDPSDGAAKFDALADMIVNNLKAPDIIAVEEVQDNNGPTNDSLVDASQTYNVLIERIQAAGGPVYQFRNINPVDDQDGGEPGGNIRVGFLFRTDRGLSFVDRPGGGSTTATTVVNTAGGPQLSASPGRIDPTNPAYNSSRKPLAGEFLYNGQKLFVIANHFNSKGGDQPLFGRYQPPTRSSEVQRLQQATIVANFVKSLLAADPQANIVVAGDLNDFQFSPALQPLKDAGLKFLIETLPENERYSYVFEGNSQALDHILVSQALFARLAEYDIVHANAEFADQISDHDPQVARFNMAASRPGFLTGGGYLSTPDGKAHFELSAKYEQGAATPTGEFVFSFNGHVFRSTAINWVTSSGKSGYLQGNGTLDGQAGYSFLVAVVDGKPDDYMRVRLASYAGQVIFDNQPNAPLDATPVNPLGGGNITVHK